MLEQFRYTTAGRRQTDRRVSKQSRRPNTQTNKQKVAMSQAESLNHVDTVLFYFAQNNSKNQPTVSTV